MAHRSKKAKNARVIPQATDCETPTELLEFLIAREKIESGEIENQKRLQFTNEIDELEDLFDKEEEEIDPNELPTKIKEEVKGDLNKLLDCFQKEAKRFEQDFKNFVKASDLKKKSFRSKAEHKHEKLDIPPFIEKLKRVAYQGSDFQFITENELVILESLTTFKAFELNWSQEYEDKLKGGDRKLKNAFLLLSQKMRERNKLPNLVYDLIEKYIYCDYENNYITLVFSLDSADVYYVFIVFKVMKLTINALEEELCKIPESMTDFLDRNVVAEKLLKKFWEVDIEYVNKFYFTCGCENY